MEIVRRRLRDSGAGSLGQKHPGGSIAPRLMLAQPLPPIVAITTTAMLMAAICAAMDILHRLFPEARLILTYLLIPVAFGAAVFPGKGAAFVTAATLATALALVILVQHSDWRTETLGWIDFLGLSVGALIIMGVIGRLRTSLSALTTMHEDLRVAGEKLIESEERRLASSREVLAAVTGSRLVVCDEAELESMIRGVRLLELPIDTPRQVSDARRALKGEVIRLGLLYKRLQDFEASSTEAMTNALGHAGGGRVELFLDHGDVLVHVCDRGGGIAQMDLARATLQKGFSTRISLGMGFKMIWEMADMLAVATSPCGTRILIRINENAVNEFEHTLLDRYPESV